jgi:hypothetical protein
VFDQGLAWNAVYVRGCGSHRCARFMWRVLSPCPSCVVVVSTRDVRIRTSSAFPVAATVHVVSGRGSAQWRCRAQAGTLEQQNTASTGSADDSLFFPESWQGMLWGHGAQGTYFNKAFNVDDGLLVALRPWFFGCAMSSVVLLSLSKTATGVVTRLALGVPAPAVHLAHGVLVLSPVVSRWYVAAHLFSPSPPAPLENLG